MGKTTTFMCDLKGCEEQLTEGESQKQYPAIFTTEQTEGRGIAPTSISFITIDVCSKHRQQMVRDRKMLTASGAQGFNDYWI